MEVNLEARGKKSKKTTYKIVGFINHHGEEKPKQSAQVVWETGRFQGQMFTLLPT